jgi:hypothetical protein
MPRDGHDHGFRERCRRWCCHRWADVVVYSRGHRSMHEPRGREIQHARERGAPTRRHDAFVEGTFVSLTHTQQREPPAYGRRLALPPFRSLDQAITLGLGHGRCLATHFVEGSQTNGSLPQRLGPV